METTYMARTAGAVPRLEGVTMTVDLLGEEAVVAQSENLPHCQALGATLALGLVHRLGRAVQHRTRSLRAGNRTSLETRNIFVLQQAEVAVLCTV